MFLQVLLSLLTLASSNPPRVAVMPLSARSVGSEDVEMVTDILAGQLTARSGLRVMERSEMNRILQEQGFQQSGACDGQKCAVEVGRILGLDEMVVGSFGRLGDSWALAVRRVSVETGEILGQSTRQYVGPLSSVPEQLVAPAVADLSGAPNVVVSPATPWSVGASRARREGDTADAAARIGSERVDSIDAGDVRGPSGTEFRFDDEQYQRGKIVQGFGVAGLVAGGTALILSSALLSGKNDDSTFTLHGSDRETWKGVGVGGMVVAFAGLMATITGQNMIESASVSRPVALSLEPVQGCGASGTASGLALSARF